MPNDRIDDTQRMKIYKKQMDGTRQRCPCKKKKKLDWQQRRIFFFKLARRELLGRKINITKQRRARKKSERKNNYEMA